MSGARPLQRARGSGTSAGTLAKYCINVSAPGDLIGFRRTMHDFDRNASRFVSPSFERLAIHPALGHSDRLDSVHPTTNFVARPFRWPPDVEQIRCRTNYPFSLTALPPVILC